MGDAPYKSVNHALRSAYTALGKPVIQQSSALAQMRGGGVRLPDSWWSTMGPKTPGTPYHRIAQAAMVISLVEQSLSGARMLAVEAFYIDAKPMRDDGKDDTTNDPNLLLRKQGRIVALAQRIYDLIDGSPDSRYVLAAVGAWAGFGKVDDKEWAEQLGVHLKTLQRWRTGRGEYGQGITGILDDWLDGARRELGRPMREAGLIL